MNVVARAAYEAWGEYAAFTLVCRPDDEETWTLTADALFDEEPEEEEPELDEEEEPDE